MHLSCVSHVRNAIHVHRMADVCMSSRRHQTIADTATTRKLQLSMFFVFFTASHTNTIAHFAHHALNFISEIYGIQYGYATYRTLCYPEGGHHPKPDRMCSGRIWTFVGRSRDMKPTTFVNIKRNGRDAFNKFQCFKMVRVTWIIREDLLIIFWPGNSKRISNRHEISNRCSSEWPENCEQNTDWMMAVVQILQTFCK